MTALCALPAAVFLLASLSGTPAHAQLSKGGTPPSQDATRNANLPTTVSYVTMPKVDVAALRVEDEQNAGKAMPWRFGQNLAVDIGPATHGSWATMADGGRLWRVGIYSKDALSINLLFDRFHVPPGAELFVYSQTKSHTIGAFTEANHQAAGSLSTTLVRGDRIVIEYYEPANAAFSGTLHLSRVTHGYRGPEDYANKAFGSSGNCNNNTICPISAGWEQQIDSVVMLVMGGSGFCTGTLINNTAEDLTPYLLTANHCYSDPADWVFWFNWESPSCQNPGAVPEYQSLSGAVLRARRSESDFCLVELNDAVPEGYEPYWAGFDYTGDTPAETTGIHHPRGDIKKFSQDNDPPSISAYLGAPGSGTTHWRVNDWDDGTTEPGSSGSALFDHNQRLIGQLHGGSAACGNNAEDFYGRLSVSWDGPGPQQRLRDWLDPAGMDPGAIDGTVPTQYPNDAAISAVINPVPDSNSCDTEVVPEVILRNAGADDLTSVDIQYSINGGAPDTYAWTGLLTSGATESVTLPNLTLAPGPNTLEFNTLAPNGIADDNPANDLRSVTFNVLEAVGQNLPLLEDFEDSFPPVSWINENPDGQFAWEAGAVSAFGVGGGSAYHNNYDDNNTGSPDSLITPFLNLGPAPTTIQFDIAYARYNDSLFDSMEVQVSEDCGATWTQVWSKSGTELSTTGADIAEPFEPAAAQWRTEVIDISAYANIPSAQFAFVNVTGWGNNLYLDNINIGGAPPADDYDGDGYTIAEGDCHDGDASINPGAPELFCDSVDNDCDAATSDEGDGDGDGVSCVSDCNDNDSLTYPGAQEICDMIDNDCDNVTAVDLNCVDGTDSGGCLCSTTDMTPGSLGGMLFLFGLVLVGTRRRRRQA